MKKNFLRVFFSCILTLFVSILALAICLSYFAKDYVCNDKHMEAICSKSSYSNTLYEEIRYDWENLISITGITEYDEILSVLTSEKVNSDAIIYITSSYSGTPVLDTESLQANLEAKIRDYASSHNISATPDSELEQNITDLVDACIEDYRSAITVPMLPKILSRAASLSAFVEMIIPACAIAAGLLLLFIFFIQQKKQDVLYYATLGGITDGILLVGITHLIRYHEIISRLPFEESALKVLIFDYLQSLVVVLENYGYYFLFVAAGCFILFLVIQAIALIAKKAKSKATPEAE